MQHTRRALITLMLAACSLLLLPSLASSQSCDDSILPGAQTPGCYDGSQTSIPTQEPTVPQEPATTSINNQPAPTTEAHPAPTEPTVDNSQPAPTTPANPATEDPDAPLIPDVQNPDDDGDGATDNVDMDPNDPNIGANPDIPVEDGTGNDDGDLLPNILDPDDNNNGIPDNRDPGTTAPLPENPDTTSPQPPTNGDSTSPTTSPSTGSQNGVVRQLPSTGSVALDMYPEWQNTLLAACLCGILGLAVLPVFKKCRGMR